MARRAEGGGGPGHAPDAGTRPPFRLGNRPALTGIRAPAVAVVVVFHSNFRTFPGSWAALSVFFVLSGFLITTMLAGERQRTGTVSLRGFYARRAVRLLPPLVVAVALLGAYAATVPVFEAASRLWGDAAAALLYFADYRSAFGHEPLLGYLSQCWSLAVEEQFYLVWAILFVVALRVGRTRALAYGLAVAGIVAAAADRTWLALAPGHWSAAAAARAYYAFDSRADALFVGCLLGLAASGGLLDRWRPWALRTTGALAAVSTAVLVWILFHVSLAPRSLPLVWMPVSEVASAVVLVHLVVRPRGWGARVLGLRPLVLLGNLSYTIYIVHWPVYVAISPFTVRWSYWPMLAVRLAVILSLSFASWYLMERPLMRWRRRAFESRTPSAPTAVTVPAGTGGPPPSVPVTVDVVAGGPVRPATVATE